MAATDVEIITQNLAGFIFDEISWQHVPMVAEMGPWILVEIITVGVRYNGKETDWNATPHAN